MATTFKLKRFTKYDETDNLKRMKDSDILAEQKKTADYGNVITKGLGGAITGGAVGLGAGAITGLATGSGARLATAGAKAAQYGKIGALVGGGILAVNALRKLNKEAADNQFYNNRLEYAQRQAKRRERKDWKANMTQRDGYSY